jgi:hypothetical protein
MAATARDCACKTAATATAGSLGMIAPSRIARQTATVTAVVLMAYASANADGPVYPAHSVVARTAAITTGFVIRKTVIAFVIPASPVRPAKMWDQMRPQRARQLCDLPYAIAIVPIAVYVMMGSAGATTVLPIRIADSWSVHSSVVDTASVMERLATARAGRIGSGQTARGNDVLRTATNAACAARTDAVLAIQVFMVPIAIRTTVRTRVQNMVNATSIRRKVALFANVRRAGWAKTARNCDVPRTAVVTDIASMVHANASRVTTAMIALH